MSVLDLSMRLDATTLWQMRCYEQESMVRRAIKMDGSLRAEFIEDSAFDGVWDSF